MLLWNIFMSDLIVRHLPKRTSLLLASLDRGNWIGLSGDLLLLKQHELRVNQHVQCNTVFECHTNRWLSSQLYGRVWGGGGEKPVLASSAVGIEGEMSRLAVFYLKERLLRKVVPCNIKASFYGKQKQKHSWGSIGACRSPFECFIPKHDNSNPTNQRTSCG